MSQVERLTYIDRRIKTRGGVTAREVAERFEVSRRQVTRDIEYLRDRLGAPIVWIAAERRYQYAETWTGLDFADEKALLFYVFARAAAGTIAYVPMAEESALERFLDLIPKKMRRVEQAIRYELPEYEIADVDTLVLLVRAMADSKRLDIRYRDAEGRQTERTIEVLRLVNYAGSWYCVAYDTGKRRMRTFKVSRFAHIALSSEKAEHPVSDEEIEEFLKSSYGMFKGKGDKKAVIRFYGRAIPIVRDEVWHPEQIRREGNDTSRGAFIELSVPVSRWDEILGRILRFGADAEPVEPKPLRELWKAEIARMAALALERKKT